MSWLSRVAILKCGYAHTQAVRGCANGLIDGGDTSYYFSNVKDGTAYDIKVYAQNAARSRSALVEIDNTTASGSNVKGNIHRR